MALTDETHQCVVRCVHVSLCMYARACVHVYVLFALGTHERVCATGCRSNSERFPDFLSKNPGPFVFACELM